MLGQEFRFLSGIETMPLQKLTAHWYADVGDDDMRKNLDEFNDTF